MEVLLRTLPMYRKTGDPPISQMMKLRQGTEHPKPWEGSNSRTRTGTHQVSSEWQSQVSTEAQRDVPGVSKGRRVLQREEVCSTPRAERFGALEVGNPESSVI